MHEMFWPWPPSIWLPNRPPAGLYQGDRPLARGRQLLLRRPGHHCLLFRGGSQGHRRRRAQLHFQHQAAEAWCYDCNQTVTLTERGQACPECGGYKLRVAQGDSLRITDIEVS